MKGRVSLVPDHPPHSGASRTILGWSAAALAAAMLAMTAGAQEIGPQAPLDLPPLPFAAEEAPSHRVGQGAVPDSTGLVPRFPPGPPKPEAPGAVNRRIDGLLESVRDPEAEINVVIGRSKLLTAKPGKVFRRIAVANPAVVDVRLLDDARLLNVYGLSFGATNLTLFDADDQPISILVRVTIDAPDVAARIKQIYPAADIRLKQVGPQVILEGQVPDSKTMAEVLQLIESELLGAYAASGGSAGGGGGGLARREKTDDVRQAAFQAMQGPPGGVVPSPGGGPAAPTGPAAPPTVINNQTGGPGEPSPARSGGGTLPPGTIINRVRVPGPRQILLHVKLAELNRTALRQVGVNWLDTRNTALLGSTVGGVGNITGRGGSIQNAAFSPLGLVPQPIGSPIAARTIAPGFQPVASTFNSTANALSNPLTSQLFGVFNAGEFNLFINALRENSLAKILAEPNLVTLDGQPARFLAGGSFPFPVPQTSTFGGPAITIQFRDFGAILQFVPHILDRDEIKLDIEPAFSQLDFATGTSVLGTTVPGLTQRSARTVVQMREGQTLAIAGLLQTTSAATTTRVPILGDIPVVAPLFSRNTITTVETELVVLVTPELVAPIEPCDVPPSPGDLVMEPNDWEFYFLGRIEGKSGIPHRATTREHDPLDVMKHLRSEGRWVIGPHGHAD